MNTTMHGGKTMAGGTDDGGGRRRSLWKGPALTTALILLIPLLGNHFVDGWNWPPGTFVVLGALLFGIGLTYELVTRNRDAIAYRAAVGDCVPVPGYQLVCKSNAEEEGAEHNKGAGRPVPSINEMVPQQGYQQDECCGQSRALPEALTTALILLI